jgi:hypothetical protein
LGLQVLEKIARQRVIASVPFTERMRMVAGLAVQDFVCRNNSFRSFPSAAAISPQFGPVVMAYIKPRSVTF